VTFSRYMFGLSSQAAGLSSCDWNAMTIRAKRPLPNSSILPGGLIRNGRTSSTRPISRAVVRLQSEVSGIRSCAFVDTEITMREAGILAGLIRRMTSIASPNS